MRIKLQFFVALLASSALLIAVMYVVSNVTFNRGFLAYVNESQRQQLQPLASALENRYRQYGHWNWVLESPAEFRALLDSSLTADSRFRMPPPGEAASPGRPDRPPPQPSRPPGPTLPDQRPFNNPPSFDQPSPGAPPPRPLAIAPSDNPMPPPGAPGLVLADSEKSPVFGSFRPGDNSQWIPLQIPDEAGELFTVGYLGFSTLTRLDSEFDRSFARQQRVSFTLAAASLALLSALLALPLAQRISRPVVTIQKAVSSLDAGNYKHRINEQRGDELGELAAMIDRLAATLQTNRDTRQSLFAEISHELRTPVAVLQAELEALLDGVREFDSDVAAALHSETLRLGRLIDDLKTLSVLDTGTLGYQMQPLNLAELLSAQLNSSALNREQLDVRFHSPSSPVIINADEQRLQQVFANLLHNSIRYTDSPGSLTVTLNCDPSAGDTQATILWEDSAPGVPGSMLEKLFEPLFRAEQSRSRQSGGSGLGLAIARKILQAHDGSIQAGHSSLGGLQLRVTLPVIRHEETA